MYNETIRIAGTLTSDVSITPEQLACIPTILKENELGSLATVSANNPEAVRIAFDFTGARLRNRNPSNFAFAENIARVAEICEEISLGLIGEVIIRDFIEGAPETPSDAHKFVGEIYKVTVSEGKSAHTGGIIFAPSNETKWGDASTPVKVRPKRLDFG